VTGQLVNIVGGIVVAYVALAAIVVAIIGMRKR